MLLLQKQKRSKNAFGQEKQSTYYRPSGWVHAEANHGSPVVSDIVAGCQVRPLDGFEKGFQKVMLPDGRVGFVPASALLPPKVSNDFVETGLQFLGVPYLWGGTSSKGFDCSGFTKTIYALNGYLIPRDASQQIHAGKEIKTDKNMEKFNSR